MSCSVWRPRASTSRPPRRDRPDGGRAPQADRRLEPGPRVLRASSGRDARRTPRWRRPRYGTPRVARPPRRDLDRECDDRRGSRCLLGQRWSRLRRDVPRGLHLSASARRARPTGVRLVLQRRCEPHALVHPALPLGPQGRAEPRRRPAPRLDGGLRGREPELRRGGAGRARARATRIGVLPRLSPVPRAAARAGGPARRDAAALRAHPVGAGGLLARVAARDPPADPRGDPRERRRRIPHAALEPQLPALLRGLRRRTVRRRQRDP